MILVFIAISLIVLAVFLLVNSALGLTHLLNPERQTDARTLAIDVLDTVLLAMMTMEIVVAMAGPTYVLRKSQTFSPQRARVEG